jgi:hypothetical protein
MLAGMASMAILYPVNHALGRRYATYQKALMKARDSKTTVITEALNGIRQIKFSAIEKQWTEKIDEVREKELQKIWETRLNNSKFHPKQFSLPTERFLPPTSQSSWAWRPISHQFSLQHSLWRRTPIFMEISCRQSRSLP